MESPPRTSIFRLRFFWNLYSTYALLVVATSASIGLLVDRQMENALLSEVTASMRDKTVLLSEYLGDAFTTRVAPNLTKLRSDAGVRITLILPDGTVLAETERPAAELDNHLARPEIQQALHEPFGFSRRYSQTLGHSLLYVARAVREGDQVRGFVRVSIGLQSLDGRLSTLRTSIAAAALLGVLAALALGILAGHRITRPIYQEQAQLRSMVAGIPVGLVAVDGVDRVLFANQAACEMLGYDFSKIVGRRLGTLAKELPDVARIARQDHAEYQESEFTVGDITVSAHAAKFEGGGLSSVVVVLEDVTSLKRLERIRRDFVANVSHEIKTPLTSIKGYVETLITGALYDEQNNMRFLHKIDDHVGRLTNLVQDLLSLARIEAQEGSLRLTENDWRPMIESAVRRHERALQSRGMTCAMDLEDSDCVVAGDSESMTQVLDNLLDNAIKYTQPPGGMRVRLFRVGAQVTLEVSDTGIGIPPGDLERIFERFYRVDKARSREMGGTGLGLAIVKHLVQAMHGEVRVESEVGKGSTFSVTLPAAKTS